MARAAVNLVRMGILMGATLGLAAGTFLVLDLLGLSGADRFLAYLLLTTAIAGGIVLYATFVVVEHARQPLGVEEPGDGERVDRDPGNGPSSHVDPDPDDPRNGPREDP